MQTGQTGTVAERLSGEQPALRRNGRPGERTVRVDATIAYLLLKEVFRSGVGVTSFFGILIAIAHWSANSVVSQRRRLEEPGRGAHHSPAR
jgi:hypothetical protein